MATIMERSAQDRVWLKSYPPGVPAEADVDAFASIRDILEKSCRKFASLPAFTCMGATIDYAELDRLSREFGSWLQNVAGLKKGDRVAIMMPNVLQYPVALFGTLRAGFVVVNCNPLYTPRELEHQLNDSGRAGDRDPRELREDAAGGHRPHAGAQGRHHAAGRHARASPSRSS